VHHVGGHTRLHFEIIVAEDCINAESVNGFLLHLHGHLQRTPGPGHNIVRPDFDLHAAGWQFFRSTDLRALDDEEVVFVAENPVFHEAGETAGIRTQFIEHSVGVVRDHRVWELYNLEEDWSQSNDLATKMPEKLAQMKETFLIEAAKNKALPIGGGLWVVVLHPEQRISPPYTEWTFSGDTVRMPEFCAPAQYARVSGSRCAIARRSRVPPDGLPLAYEVMPRLDHGPRDPDEAVLAEMRAVLDKMAAIPKWST
jgi:hypothetical protein